MTASPKHGVVDQLIDRASGAISWVWLLLIAVIVLAVVLRFAFGIGRIELEELQWHLYAVGFLSGIVACAVHDRHVRVDVLYDRLSPRRRTLIDRLGTWLLLIPFCIFMLVISFDPVLHSIELREQSPDPGGIPRYLIKPLIPLGFALLLLQAIAEGLRRTDVHSAEETDEGRVPLG